MKSIGEVLVAEYPQSTTQQTRVEEFLRDVVCWCRIHGVSPVQVFQEAWSSTDFQITSDYLGPVQMMHHPLLMGKEHAAGTAVPDVACEYALAGATHCEHIVAQLDEIQTVSRGRVVDAVGFCCLIINSPYRVMGAAKRGVFAYLALGGKTSNLNFSDLSYTRAELAEAFGALAAECCFLDVKSGTDPETVVSGAQLTTWIRKNLPARRPRPADGAEG